MAWVREGECCKCGDCCIDTPFPDVPAVNGMCPLLSVVRKDGTRLCAVHDGDNEYWNKACKHWPSMPYHIENYPRCTFSFRWVEDGRQDILRS